MIVVDEDGFRKAAYGFFKIAFEKVVACQRALSSCEAFL
jgi:hypothetical protein